MIKTVGRRLNIVVAVLTWGCAWTAPLSVARAADLTGAWVTDTAACDKIFVKKGGTTSFVRNSDMHGSGFIIDGRRIRGRAANCTVSKTTEDKGGVTHMLASCATDVMLSNVQLSVKVLEDNKIVRFFPGMEGMELPYYRCPR
jgi:hypothetical protein